MFVNVHLQRNSLKVDIVPMVIFKNVGLFSVFLPNVDFEVDLVPQSPLEIASSNDQLEKSLFTVHLRNNEILENFVPQSSRNRILK